MRILDNGEVLNLYRIKRKSNHNKYNWVFLDKSDIIQLTGYSKMQIRCLTRESEALMVSDYFNWYAEKRIPSVSVQAVDQILHFKINPENDIINDVHARSTIIG